MDDLRAALHSSARRDTGEQRLLRASARGTPHSQGPRLSAKMHADDAFRAILSDCLTQAAAQAGVLRAGRSAEALHQLRVALRRLEVALGAFGAAFEQAWFADLRSRAKAISARLAPARDLDVFLDDLWNDATRSGGDFAPLRRTAERERGKAWEAVEACVASEDFVHLLDDVAALSQSRLPMGSESLPKVARGILKTAAARVKKRGRRARGLVESDLHRLRIALKKLRYLSQFFAPLYGKKKMKPYLAALKRLQEQLGGLNDIAHARAAIADLLRQEGQSEIGYGAGLIAGYYGAGRSRRAKKAMRRYRDFKALKPFWKNRG